MRGILVVSQVQRAANNRYRGNAVPDFFISSARANGCLPTVGVMNPRRNASETRELIFAACSRILQRDGLASLTLEAVALEAGLSKGGLLYHFPSKVALIEALFQHHMDRFNARLQEIAMAEEQGAGGWLRAYARASVEQITDPDHASLFASLFAAGERYPTVLALMRQSYDGWQAEIDACDLEPATALLVRLAVDGFWFTEMYQFAPLDHAARTAVLTAILRLASPATAQSS